MEYVRMFTHVDLIRFNNMLRQLDNSKEEIYDLWVSWVKSKQ